ncbi:MAG: hypothetical protein WKF91_03435 [Segetibacter sp.]
MTIENKREKILEFFKIFIKDFIGKDLEILNTITPDPHTGLGGCTIPTAMTIIASTELIGFLLKKYGNTGESKVNIAHFLNYDKASFFPAYYNSATIEKIFNYRHGMMHHFFPKFKGKFAGICKANNDGNLFVTHHINGYEEESFNVTVLAADFFEAIRKLQHFLATTNEEEVLDTMLRGLKNLDYYLQISPSITACTTINPGTPKNK